MQMVNIGGTSRRKTGEMAMETETFSFRRGGTSGCEIVARMAS